MGYFRNLLLAFVVSVVFTLTARSAISEPTKSRIIDGTRVSEHVYPAVARLTINGDLFCTGTLIGSRHILTAGHCFYDSRNRQVVGDRDVTARLAGRSFNSNKVTIHPNYRPRSSACIEGETDAALIELSEEVIGITPISLIDSVVPLGATITLVGYGTQGRGATGQNGTIPALGFVNAGNTVVEGLGDNPPRQNPLSSYFYWTFDSGEANTASGDSGGPAFYTGSGTPTIAGITCGGDGNAEFGTMSFNTRADLLKAWTDSIAGTTPNNSAPGFSSSVAITGLVGVPLSKTISLTGSQPVALTASNLPEGLSLNGNIISGVPSASGTTRVQLLASNAFGEATSERDITISNFDPNLRVRRALLQFDDTTGDNDFLDLTGLITLPKRFRPAGKGVTIQIGRFVKTFRLLANGKSSGRGSSFFDLVGPMLGNAFSKPRLQFNLSFERVPLFAELTTLGFPLSENAVNGEQVSLPLSITINDAEGSITRILRFRAADRRWVLSAS